MKRIIKIILLMSSAVCFLFGTLLLLYGSLQCKFGAESTGQYIIMRLSAIDIIFFGAMLLLYATISSIILSSAMLMYKWEIEFKSAKIYYYSSIIISFIIGIFLFLYGSIINCSGNTPFDQNKINQEENNIPLGYTISREELIALGINPSELRSPVEKTTSKEILFSSGIIPNELDNLDMIFCGVILLLLYGSIIGFKLLCKSGRLFYFVSIIIIGAIIGPSLAIYGYYQNSIGGIIIGTYEIIPYAPFVITYGVLLCFYGYIIGLVLWYNAWKSIQDGYARTTPSAAIGYIFIPIYNIYWIFQVVWGFSKDYNKYIDRHKINAVKLPEGLFLSYIILGFISSIAFLSTLGLILYIVNIIILGILVTKVYNAIYMLTSNSKIK